MLRHSLNNLADLYQAQGRYADAEPLYQAVVGDMGKSLGPDHPDVAQSLNNLAVLYNNQGRYADAEPLFKRSLAIQRKSTWSRSSRCCVFAEQSGCALPRSRSLRRCLTDCAKNHLAK